MLKKINNADVLDEATRSNKLEMSLQLIANTLLFYNR